MIQTRCLSRVAAGMGWVLGVAGCAGQLRSETAAAAPPQEAVARPAPPLPPTDEPLLPRDPTVRRVRLDNGPTY